MSRDDYQGYLQPYLPRIKELHGNGFSPNDIAKVIYDEGARSDQLYSEWETRRTLGGLIRHILRLRKPSPKKLRQRVERLKNRVEQARKELHAAKSALTEARRAERR